MVLSKRERTIALVTLSAVAILVLDQLGVFAGHGAVRAVAGGR